jgi:antitoxin HigA-1
VRENKEGSRDAAAAQAEMATRFAKLFGVSADTLMRMQAHHDLAQARTHETDIRVTPLAA